MVNGKIYSVNVDHKPTKKEAAELLAEVIGDRNKRPSSKTFDGACEQYYELKENVLSPSTIVGYKKHQRSLPEWFAKKKISAIEEMDVQKVVNDFTIGHAAKYVTNLSCFIMTVLHAFGYGFGYKITLPKKIHKEPYVPTQEEVEMIFKAAEDGKYYVPLVLAGMGMRKSEICAATPEDLDGNSLIVNKSLVQNDKNQWVIKDYPKNEGSIRRVFLPDKIVDRIHEQGCIYNGSPNQLRTALVRYQKALGIQHFPLHKMRHFFASYAHNTLHLTDAQIMAAGGWKTDNIMKTVYRHAMDMDRSKQLIADSFGGLL